VVRIEQSRAGRDNAVPVRVGIIGERDVEAILQLSEARHRVRRGAVHADPAVPVDGHEPEGWVDRVVHDRQIEPVTLGHRTPIGDAGAAERVHAQPQSAVTNRVEVHHSGQVVDVGRDVVVAVHGGALDRPLEWDAPHALERCVQQLVRLALDP
jgi:hypothetical protein